MNQYMVNASTWMLFRKFMKEMLRYRRLLFCTILSIIGASLTTLASPYVLKIIIDEYIIPHRYSELPYIAMIYLSLLIGQWLFTTLQSYSIQLFGQRFLYSIRNQLFEKLLRLKIGFYKDKQIGDLVSRVINDTSMLNEVLVSGVLSVVGSLFTLIGIVIAMIILSPSLTLVSMISVPLMIYIAKHFGGKLRRAYRATREKIAQISSVVSESMAGIEAIKSFRREEHVMKEFEKTTRETVKSYLRVAILMGFFWPLMNISSTLSIIVVLIYGGYLGLTGAVSIGVIIAFIQYVNRFTAPINNLVSMYDSLQSAFASLERIYEILEAEDIEVDEGIVLDDLRKTIVFDHVWFEYEENRPVLKDINLVIKPGEKIVLVGHTGAGKTTLANLLLGFYRPVRGKILINGVELYRVKPSFLRKRISYVPQETYLFPGTVLDNIRIGRPDASDEEVKEICRKLGIEEFIEKLPNNYYTDAGEAGKRLSVGEKQLIAIARAMLRNPDIVILDEALSSIDPHTEEIIRRAINKLMENRTGIIIAHRLTITRDSDHIIVLEDGKIVEEGSFQELMAKKGLFYKLYTTQINREIYTKPTII